MSEKYAKSDELLSLSLFIILIKIAVTNKLVVRDSFFLIQLLIIAFIYFWSKTRFSFSHNKFQSITTSKHHNGFFVCGLTVVLLAALCVVFFNLGKPLLENDEYYAILTGVGYNRTGRFVMWDLANDREAEPYTRGWPYSFLVAQVIKVLGDSEFALRFVSAVSAILLITALFVSIYKISQNVWLACCVSFTVLLNTSLLKIFRTARMYSLSMFLALILYLLIYKCFIWLEDWRKNLVKLITVSALGIILLLANYIIMPNALIPGIGVVFYMLYLGFSKKNKMCRYTILGCILFGGIITIIYCIDNTILPTGINAVLYKIQCFSGLDHTIRIQYFWQSLSIGNFYLLGGFLLLYSIIHSWKENGKSFEFRRYLSCLYVFGIIFMVFIADRYYEYRYMNILPIISAILIVWGLFDLARNIVGKILLTTLLAFLSVNQYTERFPAIYYNQRSDFREAFAKLETSFSRDECLNEFASYIGRNYYLLQYYPDINCRKAPTQSALQVDENGKIQETEIDYLIDFSKTAPHGIIWYERDKLSKYSLPFTMLLQNAATQLAGPGLDTSNVYIYEYTFADPYDEFLYTKEQDSPYYLELSEEKLIIAFADNYLPTNSKLLGITITFDNDDFDYSKKIFFDVEESLVFTIAIPDKVNNASIDSSYIVYNNTDLTCTLGNWE